MPDHCTIDLTREMLDDPVDLDLPGEGLEFAEAKSSATVLARESMSDPMLLAWFDRSTGGFSPSITCCSDKLPSWLVYAKSRGASLTVSVNSESYVFLFADFVE